MHKPASIPERKSLSLPRHTYRMESPKTNNDNSNRKPTMNPTEVGSEEVKVCTALPLAGKEIVSEKFKKSSKISDIVKLKQMLKKWRKQAHSSTTSTSNANKNNNSNGNNGCKKGSLSRSNSMKGITFLKRSLSFTDVSAAGASSNAIPKGFLAVDVGEDMKRFVIPTSYLSHQAFSVLLREAEEEFGFQQEGVLRIPCEADVFQNILKVVEAKNSPDSKQTTHLSRNDVILCGSLESQSISQSHHPASPMCR